MPKTNININQKYGRLTVIERIDNDKSFSKWKCLCDCGNITFVRGPKIGKTTFSCGCYNKEMSRLRRILPEGQSALNQLYNNYKSRARQKNFDFLISKNEFKDLTSRNCFYCGQVPLQIYDHRIRNGVYVYNGLDRIDNNKGYIIDNVVPCCKICNRMKMDLSLDEFKLHIKKIIDFM